MWAFGSDEDLDGLTDEGCGGGPDPYASDADGDNRSLIRVTTDALEVIFWGTSHVDTDTDDDGCADDVEVLDVMSLPTDTDPILDATDVGVSVYSIPLFSVFAADPAYNPIADFDKNGVIDATDAGVIYSTQYFTLSCSLASP